MKQRIITAIIFGAILLPIIIYGGMPIIILAYLLASIALYELLKMRNLSLFSIPGIISLLLLWIFLLPKEFQSILDDLNYTKIEVALFGVLLFLTYTVATKNKFTFDDVAFSIMSTFYVGIGFYYFMETRFADQGLTYLFFALFLIWATDSGAYFIGKSLGKKKLWPEISPNKTVEGSLGGVACALAVAVLFIIFTDIDESLLGLLIITAILSVFGQIGDLVESALKRHYNVKDSGNILPGHGGILDRFDSLLFVLPLLHFFHLL
ncbi:phosphatidate cytidylyltransferase [Cytobacillus firmus]|uniref:phosphatidate cytidylyltransferase n=1 Tax=Cytobacillus firmus TaxID=1399 RepID=UPI00077C4318|nr:phosphatidate cytidylyltransferase [Cytobacillus firmus]MBG9542091.1 phosphatidate cytidylyltransferase [Cytobacillus firmus]MBG9551595.1 phosphatidate cytidylyltransferase [Cytobacillus firmus]MBG9556622.1 phosphatidate cytidylyltransferase [Cytobacillus firmus]MBG9576013.1 phosphatidate cytidylyltransferase [Cytobacillus firmus]MEC1892802.1 phosphatidate cytidylyltransferase [Cytobacillus firmus]